MAASESNTGTQRVSNSAKALAEVAQVLQKLVNRFSRCNGAQHPQIWKARSSFLRLSI